MEKYIKQINESVKFIRSRIENTIDIAIVLGSGLSNLIDDFDDKIILNYSEIPGFPKTTVDGHSGKLVFAKYMGKNTLFFNGRHHYYEGYDMKEVTLYVRILKKLGINNLILTNAAGGLNTSFNPGDLMIIRDHVSLFMHESPLRGENIPEFGKRFPDMSECYSKKYRRMAENIAQEINIKLREGIYAYISGPMYETPFEIRLLSSIGVDAVGMSTVPEVIVANHSNINVLAITCITNMASGILNKKLDHNEVVQTAKSVESKMKLLISNIVERWDVE